MLRCEIIDRESLEDITLPIDLYSKILPTIGNEDRNHISKKPTHLAKLLPGYVRTS